MEGKAVSHYRVSEKRNEERGKHLSAFLAFCLLSTSLCGLSLNVLSSPTTDLPSRPVHLFCLVTDRSGQYVQSLNQQDFIVQVDGVEQEIESCIHASSENARTLNLVLLVDASHSGKPELDVRLEAAGDFLETILIRERHQAALVEFHSEVNLVQDFTSNAGELRAAMRHITARGATRLYDAVRLSTEKVLRMKQGHRVLVIFSDGRDTASNTDSEQAIEVVQKVDVTTFAVYHQERGQSSAGFLKRISKKTGGLSVNAWMGNDIRRLREAFEVIRLAIENQYHLILMVPTDPDDESLHKIKVKARNRSGLEIIHREGYFAN